VLRRTASRTARAEGAKGRGAFETRRAEPGEGFDAVPALKNAPRRAVPSRAAHEKMRCWRGSSANLTQQPHASASQARQVAFRRAMGCHAPVGRLSRGTQRPMMPNDRAPSSPAALQRRMPTAAQATPSETRRQLAWQRCHGRLGRLGLDSCGRFQHHAVDGARAQRLRTRC
jgi:hypothetical protein